MTKHFSILFLILVSHACLESSVSQFNPGLHLRVQVIGAQFHRGPLAEDNGGPSLSFVNRPQAIITRGESSIALNGRLAEGGVALHIQAQGDNDHWVLNAKGEDFVIPEELIFGTEFSLSHLAAENSLHLLMQAADAEGRLGPVTEVQYNISDDTPAANLVVSLAWDAAADVDLHLELPDGTVVGAKNIHSYETPLGQTPSSEIQPGAFLEHDSNQECRLDLRNQENILWSPSSPPAGTYRVYAHLFSPCEAEAVTMISSVWLNQIGLGSAGAIQSTVDSRVHPKLGDAPGLLMMEFEVP